MLRGKNLAAIIQERVADVVPLEQVGALWRLRRLSLVQGTSAQVLVKVVGVGLLAVVDVDGSAGLLLIISIEQVFELIGKIAEFLSVSEALFVLHFHEMVVWPLLSINVGLAVFARWWH